MTIFICVARKRRIVVSRDLQGSGNPGQPSDTGIPSNIRIMLTIAGQCFTELNSRMKREGNERDRGVMRQQTLVLMLMGRRPGIPINFVQEFLPENRCKTCWNIKRVTLEWAQNLRAPVIRPRSTEWTKFVVDNRR